MKTCITCGNEKALTAFSTVSVTKKDGTTARKSECETCCKKRQRENNPVTYFARKRRAGARNRAKKFGCEIHSTAREKAVYREAVALELADGIKRHVDHVIPLADGGPHKADNLQILTVDEHLAKSKADRIARSEVAS